MEFLIKSDTELLKFLLQNLKGSRNNIKMMLKNKQILVNNKIETQFNYMLKQGDTVRIKAKNEKTADIEIIFEDDDFIAVNKPSGMLTIATEKEKEKTAYHKLTEYAGKVFIVHRLDAETSGVVLFAKSEKIKNSLQDNWQDIVKLRSYKAVVEGKPIKDKMRIESYLSETSTHLMYSTKIKNEGKKAVTNYEVLKSNGKYSLLAIFLETGRKNQIRVHMNDIGNPVTGDKRYGSKNNPIGRLCLHADILEFEHPVTKETVHIESVPPKKMLKLAEADK